jgi:hypothetical protein
MAARFRGQREIDKHPDFERVTLVERRSDWDGVVNAEWFDNGQTLSFPHRSARLLL